MGDPLLALLQPCASYSPNIERVTAITDEKTISGEANRARYSPMKPKTSTLAPKSNEPPVLIPIEQQIQQRAYELYEQRGRTDGHELDDWLQAEREIKGITQAKAA
jgi:hypothetical protein